MDREEKWEAKAKASWKARAGARTRKKTLKQVRNSDF